MPDRPTDPRAFFFDCGGVASVTPCPPQGHRYAASLPSAKAATEDQRRATRILAQPNPLTADPFAGTLDARAKGVRQPGFTAANRFTPQAKLSATPPAKLSTPPARQWPIPSLPGIDPAAIYLARRIDQPVKPPAPKPGQVRLSAEDIYAARRKAIEEVNHA